MPATFEVLWPLCAVELNGNQVKQPLNINPPAGLIQRFPECLGCPRNGKQVWAYRIRSSEQEVFRKTLVGNYVANQAARPGDFFRELLMPL